MFKLAFILGVLAVPQLAMAMAGGGGMHSGGHCNPQLGHGCTDFKGPNMFGSQGSTIVTLLSNQVNGPLTIIDGNEVRRREEQVRLDRERRDREEREARERAEREAEDERQRQIAGRRNELRGYFTTFVNRTEAHDRSSIRTFVNGASSHLLTYPENINIAQGYFDTETRRFQKATIGGVIYVAQPSNVEVVNWLRDTAGFTSGQFASLDNIRAQRLSGGSSIACMFSMPIPESSRERVTFNTEQCSAIDSFSEFVLTLQ